MGLALYELRGEGSRGAPVLPHQTLGAGWDGEAVENAAQCLSLCRGRWQALGRPPVVLGLSALDGLGEALSALFLHL